MKTINHMYNRRSKKRNLRLIIFGLIIFVAEDFFCLIDLDCRVYSFIPLILLAWGLIEILRLRNTAYHNFSYSSIIILYLASILFSCINATVVNGEPLHYALIGAIQAVVMILYFPIRYFVDKYGRERITKIVLNLGVLISGLLLLQSAIYPRFIFINTASSTRLGRYRTYYFMTIVIFGILFYISKIFVNKMSKFDVLKLSIHVIAFILVQQTKSAIAAVVVACIIVFLFEITRGKTRYKILILSMVAFGAYLGRDFLGQLYFEAISALNEAAQTTTGNFGVRLKMIDFILNSIKNHKLIGLGYYYGGWSNADYITGWAYKYAMGDVGFYQQLFHLGYVGLILSGIVLFKMTKDIFRIRKSDNYHYFGKLVILYMLFISPFNFYFTSDTLVFYLCIYMSIFEESAGIGAIRNEE